jgi:hypothetical protein
MWKVLKVCSVGCTAHCAYRDSQWTKCVENKGDNMEK